MKSNEPANVTVHPERALIGVDGDHAFALLGLNIQEGEAEFVKIKSNSPRQTSEWEQAANKASREALGNLRKRLGYLPNGPVWLSYALHPSHPFYL